MSLLSGLSPSLSFSLPLSLPLTSPFPSHHFHYQPWLAVLPYISNTVPFLPPSPPPTHPSPTLTTHPRHLPSSPTTHLPHHPPPTPTTHPHHPPPTPTTHPHHPPPTLISPSLCLFSDSLVNTIVYLVPTACLAGVAMVTACCSLSPTHTRTSPYCSIAGCCVTDALPALVPCDISSACDLMPTACVYVAFCKLVIEQVSMWWYCPG